MWSDGSFWRGRRGWLCGQLWRRHARANGKKDGAEPCKTCKQQEHFGSAKSAKHGAAERRPDEGGDGRERTSAKIAASVSVVRNSVDQHVFAGHNQNLSGCEDHHRDRQPPQPGGA